MEMELKIAFSMVGDSSVSAEVNSDPNLAQASQEFQQALAAARYTYGICAYPNPLTPRSHERVEQAGKKLQQAWQEHEIRSKQPAIAPVAQPILPGAQELAKYKEEFSQAINTLTYCPPCNISFNSKVREERIKAGIKAKQETRLRLAAQLTHAFEGVLDNTTSVSASQPALQLVALLKPIIELKNAEIKILAENAAESELKLVEQVKALEASKSELAKQKAVIELKEAEIKAQAVEHVAALDALKWASQKNETLFNQEREKLQKESADRIEILLQVSAQNLKAEGAQAQEKANEQIVLLQQLLYELQIKFDSQAAQSAGLAAQLQKNRNVQDTLKNLFAIFKGSQATNWQADFVQAIQSELNKSE